MKTAASLEVKVFLLEDPKTRGLMTARQLSAVSLETAARVDSTKERW